MTGRKTWMLLPLFLFYLNGHTQNFAWKSKLDTVQQSGFYSIPLSLDWLAHLKSDLSDVRIKDKKNEVVPFVIRTHPLEKSSSFINFPILKNTVDSISTTLELDVQEQHGTDHLCLVIGNHAVERFASLSGSDDQNRWFIIHEKLPLTNRASLADDRFVQWLSFPFIRYRYLRLKIYNKGTDPLPLLKAGIYTATTISEQLPLYLHPGTIFRQKDSSDGKTYVWAHNAHAYPVDRISIKLAGPKFFRRAASIYKLGEETPKELLAVTEINSNDDPAIWVVGGKTQKFLIIIENGDNPPLKINQVRTQCRRQELVAWLEKGNQYVLQGGNESVNFPNYDLAHFRDSIPLHLPTIHHGPIFTNDNQALASTEKKNWWIWPSVITMMLVLILLTYRLIGDMKKGRTSATQNKN